MKTYLYAWDFGTGWGHLVMAKPILKRLLDNGNQVFLVAPDVIQARDFLQLDQLQILKRPALATGTPTFNRISRCWTELQLELGYGQDAQLASNLQQWLRLLQSISPDCVIADYSLSVQILRARLGFPLIRVGNGFCCPPRDVLMSSFFPDFPLFSTERDDLSARLLQSITVAQQVILGTCSSSLAELFKDDCTILWTVPEFDHFPNRAADERHEYLGPIISSQSDQPSWCHSGTPKILVYLWSFAGVERILEYLKIVRFDTVVIQRDFPQSMIEKFSCRHLRFVPPSLNMNQAAQECDLFIGNSGPGVAYDLLSAGKPVILCAGHIEQAILGMKLERLGLARLFWIQEPEHCIAEIQRHFDDPSTVDKCQAFAAKLRTMTTEQQLDRLCEVIRQVQR